ncbi:MULTISPECIES: permease [unclassified Mycolicibacterium]|uniref:permease n=1 Tax=unclassified Mycolicibacterium TaxID=2636767 RepID=UPI001305C18C|nr:MULTISPECIES: permease [unclassified Mycolicibacterium]MUL81802.1 permease [Mycolicibacterium sp. CBMA 329]MUL87568.1 permease [Mycolicibacterium sp. CBMA 331]MUL99568.1 permease [Mycolicibacterium sp. CBMA 334]MUM26585.1 permease [Mycolicibacterium sp. CBMA 295]MUM37865.1 permease [Mycolicibacterium sp. CBMA 247]
MTERGEARTTSKPSAWVHWRGRLIGGLALVVVLVTTYFILAAFLPRWWAQRIADMSGHGSFAKGIGWGLTLGFLGTAIPLLLLLVAVLAWRHRAGPFVGGAAAVVAVIAALPNLMTLSITLGTNSAAHAGQRILDVDAPGFRGATLIAAIIAVVVALFIAFLAVRHRRRKSEAH